MPLKRNDQNAEAETRGAEDRNIRVMGHVSVSKTSDEEEGEQYP